MVHYHPSRSMAVSSTVFNMLFFYYYYFGLKECSYSIYINRINEIFIYAVCVYDMSVCFGSTKPLRETHSIRSLCHDTYDSQSCRRWFCINIFVYIVHIRAKQASSNNNNKKKNSIILYFNTYNKHIICVVHINLWLFHLRRYSNIFILTARNIFFFFFLLLLPMLLLFLWLSGAWPGQIVRKKNDKNI